MAMKAKYTVFDGEIVSHVRNGIRRDLVSTPDGSIAATLTSTPTTGATYTYWPFGNPRSTSGDANNSTPFRYKGSYGYYFDSSNRHYVRARYMNGTYGRWYTQDPFWPCQQAYKYADNNPLTKYDPSGKIVILIAGVVYAFSTWDLVVIAVTFTVAGTMVAQKMDVCQFKGTFGTAAQDAIIQWQLQHPNDSFNKPCRQKCPRINPIQPITPIENGDGDGDSCPPYTDLPYCAGIGRENHIIDPRKPHHDFPKAGIANNLAGLNILCLAPNVYNKPGILRGKYKGNKICRYEGMCNKKKVITDTRTYAGLTCISDAWMR